MCATMRCCSESSPDQTASIRGNAASPPAITPRRSTAASKGCASACSRKVLACIIPSRTSMRACAARRFASLGAAVEDISVPTHAQGFPVWAAIRGDAACVTLLEMNGAGINHEGLYVLSLMDKAMAWRSRADDFADTIKIASIFSKYTVQRYGGRYYGKAQNIRRRLRAAYDAALKAYDLLLLPTTPMKATPIPPKGATPQEITRRSWEATGNTCPFNVTGHPAISLPCGVEDGRPIGMMLVGRAYDEATIYRAAAAFERSGDWTTF